MTTIPVATEAQRDALRKEAADIARRRPDVLADAERAFRETPDVKAWVTLFAKNADVKAETGRGVWPATVTLSTVGQTATLMLDAVTAHRLFLELDAVVGVCAGCRLPFPRSEMDKCAGNGADWCALCHGPVCSSRADCFGDGS